MNVQEVETKLTQIGAEWDKVKLAPDRLDALDTRAKLLEASHADLRSGLADLKLVRHIPQRGPRRRGYPSEEAARAVGAQFILMLAKAGNLESVIQDSAARDRLYAEAKGIFGISQKVTSLTTSEISLPYEYGREVQELIADYGVARKELTRYPIGRGTARPARVTTGLTAFTILTMSAEVTAKTVTFGYASLESHKYGGLVTIPRELDEQGAADIGSYLMRYGAIRFAKIEDTMAFLADASATYESTSGIAKVIATDTTNLLTLDGGETSPDDITIDDLRNMRVLIDVGAYSGAKYYMHHTMEAKLRQFNTQAEPTRFVYRPDGGATLDGWPIVWTNVLQAFTTSAAAATYPVFFGDLTWWWFGEHGVPRIDTSWEARFYYDELAVRFIEEIDVDYAAMDSVAVLKTAAS